MKPAPWSLQQLQILRDLYPLMMTAELPPLVGRSIKSINNKAHALGLKKVEGAASRAGKLGAHHPDAIAKRFPKGLTPWNKGKPFPRSGRMQEGQFKRGQLPPKTRPLGAVRINKDGLPERKIENGEWWPVHRIIWCAANGPLTNGHVVVFKPGVRVSDAQAIKPEHLECVSRAELMQRNSYHRLPKELATVIHLRGVLNRQIRKRERDEK
jgi:hypothetical protein